MRAPIPTADIPRPGRGSATGSSRWEVTLVVGLIALAAFAAYSNSFGGPFVFDDKPSIPDNPTLRHLWPPLAAFPPPGGLTVSGRPILNVSLALNHAVGGTNVRGYHAVNLLIHACAGLVLFGLVRRTLLLPRLHPRFGRDALAIAGLVAGLWTLHPLQTESVTYIVQRAESLMGLFYLLTLYAFVRARQSYRSGPWLAFSTAACLLGMATKEVMVSAPLLVLLFDRTFVSATFQVAWQRSRVYYASLAATWIPLGLLVAGNGGNRGGSIGFGTGVSWWHHALSQFEAVTRYLQLSVWPHPLVFEYGPLWRQDPQDIVPCALFVAALLAATAYALRRFTAAGFLGLWFFAILAPTCLMPGSTQIFVEHRMYLALVPLVALAVAGAHALGGRRSLAGLLLLAGGLGILTYTRNSDYRSELALWQDTVAKRPFNSMARSSLGSALVQAGRRSEAIAEFEAALQLWPGNAEAHTNLGEALSAAGRSDEALDHLQTALRLRPDYPEAQLNLGTALDRIGRTADAISHYESALRAKPELVDAHNNLGNALLRSGRATDAIGEIREALRLKPEYASAHYNLANALVQAGRLSEAAAEFASGHRLNPSDPAARRNWAGALAASGHLTEAIAEYDIAIREQPSDPGLLYDYGNALGAAKRFPEAIRCFTEALQLKPDYPEALDNLGNALVMLDRVPEAIAPYEQALHLKPDDPGMHNNLGLAFARLGRMQEAADQFAAAVQHAPGFQAARENLAHAQAELAHTAPRN